MGIKSFKPTTSGRRFASVDSYADITKRKPERSLIVRRKKFSGRNSQGKITVRHRGGGNRQFVRVVDFRQERYDIPAKVAAIEYDPIRGARLALLHYRDGVKRYIILPQDVKVGDMLVSSKELVEIKPGNRMPLEKIPIGVLVHNIELSPGNGGAVVRGAGLSAQFLAVEGKYANIRLPSGEVRLFPKEAMATIGMVSNPDHRLVRIGKAGRMRHRGRKPQVRGKVMNPVDHPHGGGEGKQPIGLKHPKTKWGKPALGVKTRDRKKASWKFIVSRRKKK
jgi:large subunit ribosomal protein L2